MRTTVTLDPDAERLLRQTMQQTGQSFKVALNEAVRKGLADIAAQVEEPPFVVHAQDMGLRSGVDLANVHDLETELEIQAHLDVTRKLQERQAKKRHRKDGQNRDRS